MVMGMLSQPVQVTLLAEASASSTVIFAKACFLFSQKAMTALTRTKVHWRFIQLLRGARVVRVIHALLKVSAATDSFGTTAPGRKSGE